MKKALAINKKSSDLYHVVDGKKVMGLHKDLHGNVSGLYGDVSRLYGNVSGLHGDVSRLYGNVSGLLGNVSGLYGDCTNLLGNLDDCKITDEDRKRGVDIKDLVMDSQETK